MKIRNISVTSFKSNIFIFPNRYHNANAACQMRFWTGSLGRSLTTRNGRPSFNVLTLVSLVIRIENMQVTLLFDSFSLSSNLFLTPLIFKQPIGNCMTCLLILLNISRRRIRFIVVPTYMQYTLEHNNILIWLMVPMYLHILPLCKQI